MKDIFKIGNKRPIEETEIYEVKDGMRSDRITDRINNGWTEEKSKKTPAYCGSCIECMERSYYFGALLFRCSKPA